MMSSVTSSSITVQWGRVRCIDRNSQITSYTVRYRKTSNPPFTTKSVTGTSDVNRRLTASDLEPCTSYRFEVAAVNSEERQSALYGGTTGQTAERKKFET